MNQKKILDLISARKGHFLLESGHHSDLWLDLESLCFRPKDIQAAVRVFAENLSKHNVDMVCGSLVEGAFIGLMVALQLNVEFVYSVRFARTDRTSLFPAGYRIPASLRGRLRGKRVAIVDDVINAGSAIAGTFSDLEECGAIVVAISALLILGSGANKFALDKGIPLNSLTALPNNLWTESECPLCASSVPLEDIAGFAKTFSPSNTTFC
jgi:orotate phosphoribosyltransferase